MSYQLVELENATANIICPICKLAVIDWTQEQYVQPCEHTVFIAMDLGFEFVADRFEEVMNQNVDELHEDPNINIFDAITTTPYKNLTILKADLGVDGLFRYVGISDCYKYKSQSFDWLFIIKLLELRCIVRLMVLIRHFGTFQA
ncbi:hypothetical protein BANRA_03593 [Acinetobacter baumannii]|nr:hypothetical protein BANRA_03593 [Acinetobacter baumannii]